MTAAEPVETCAGLVPLVTGMGLDDTVAWTSEGPRRVRDLVADARALSHRLPAGSHLLNACHDRYRFAVGFVAGLLTGKVSLQPSSQSEETLRRLWNDHPDLVALTDAPFDAAIEGIGLPCLPFPARVAADPAAVAEVPAFPADRLAAVLFTSGSTGLPQPHRKTWGRLAQNGRVEAERLGLTKRPHTIVGTVPVQHSYGFESTFLQVLHGGGAFWAGRPFYPQDIVAALAAVPAPRLLVTTPFHLSTLLAADLPLPETALVLSATAPLSGHLAAQAEARFGAPLHEIYGSTESGQLASRRTTAGAEWALLDGVRLEQHGDDTFALDGHVEGRVPLSDRIECLADQRFLLHGRHADLVNMAGKRTSLAYLNHQIGAVPGVVDAAFFLPDDECHGDDRVTRLTAFVVAPGVDRATLLAELRQRLDPVFLPRPLVFVEALPRNATGKLPREQLKSLYTEKVRHGQL
ncbi:MAG: AMP-binding protein [Hydrogenophaga sp.]|jgi:acyl-coenzyme A synthetase/AMP-(fatty) acid ligase|nr:AMP-binding protein [Hydrogenophaga sp.]